MDVVGALIGLSIITIIAGYLAIFGRVDKKH